MSLLERLETKVLVGDGCWEWQAAKDRDGYGILCGAPEARSTKAHRIMYELLVGPIPDGLQIHHHCGNRGCVRPDHMEPMTGRANLFASGTVPAVNAAKTHCVAGHAYADHGFPTGVGNQRGCKACNRDYARARRARLKQRAA